MTRRDAAGHRRLDAACASGLLPGAPPGIGPWWSGLTLGDARLVLRLAGDAVGEVSIAGEPYLA